MFESTCCNKSAATCGPAQTEYIYMQIEGLLKVSCQQVLGNKYVLTKYRTVLSGCRATQPSLDHPKNKEEKPCDRLLSYFHFIHPAAVQMPRWNEGREGPFDP